MIEMYTFEYNYLDKRQHRRGKTTIRYGRNKAKQLYDELLDKMKNKEASAPMELPHIIKLVNGETKLVDAEKEFK